MTNTNNISAFDSLPVAYDNWFDRHRILFDNELLALRRAIPAYGRGIEIGAGTGRFASALHIPIGAEPSAAMAKLALQRGISIVNAAAASLPFHDDSFDYALMVTVDCFLSDIPAAFLEALRIIRPGGSFVLGMIDKCSELGQVYEAKKSSSIWYHHAQFHAVPQITQHLTSAGFQPVEYWQTLFDVQEVPTMPKPGFGKGGFVVIRSVKP